jgi:hypothetical protein
MEKRFNFGFKEARDGLLMKRCTVVETKTDIRQSLCGRRFSRDCDCRNQRAIAAEAAPTGQVKFLTEFNTT